MTWRKLRPVASAIATTLLWLLALSPVGAQESAEFLDAMDWAESLMLEEDFKSAVKAYKQADRMSNGTSFDCQLGLAKAFNKIGAFKNAKECAERALELAGGPIAEASAQNQLGQALFARGASHPDDLQAAIAAFQKVIDLAPEQGNIARFNQGVALLKLGRDEEGIKVLSDFLSRQPEGREAEMARSYVDNPLRARVPLVPDFQIVTLDGEYLTSEDLTGSVVLVDFWGTWCGPCVQAIPHLRGLSRKSNKNPFILLSVSSDDDENQLREFIQEHRMDWPQVWDEEREVIRAFEVRTYPTYVLVDPTGKIVYRESGWSERAAAALSGAVSSQLRAARKLAK